MEIATYFFGWNLLLKNLLSTLVEGRTDIALVTGSNIIEAMIFSGFFFPIT